jgi:hypothetical protein
VGIVIIAKPFESMLQSLLLSWSSVFVVLLEVVSDFVFMKLGYDAKRYHDSDLWESFSLSVRHGSRQITSSRRFCCWSPCGRRRLGHRRSVSVRYRCRRGRRIHCRLFQKVVFIVVVGIVFDFVVVGLVLFA